MIYTIPASIIPHNDALRLEKLRDYRILDTHSEDTFDKIALMASQVFGSQSAFITFVDEDRVFLKSNLSLLPFHEVERRNTLSSLVILQDEPLVFSDTYEQPSLIANSFVAMDGGVRFFAGISLKSPEGHNVGALCVADGKPLNVTPVQLDMLRTLSKIVVDKLENRLRYRKGIESQINLMNMALHEIKNPLASINLANDILRKDPTAAERMTGMIKSAVTRIQAKLSDLLKQSEQEETELVLSIEEVHLNDIFTRLINNFELLAYRKNQVIQLEYDRSLPPIYADKVKIMDILHNLLSNAIKYSYNGSVIKICASCIDNNVEIEVKDEGQGLNEDDVNKLFTKFAKLSSRPTGKETSSGLGLSITKSLVEMHNGTIHAISEGKDKGTSFVVRLPLHYKNEMAEFSA